MVASLESCRVPENGVAECRLNKLSPGQVGTAEVGTAQVRGSETRVAKVRAAKVRTLEVGDAEVHAPELRMTEVCATEIGLKSWVFMAPSVPLLDSGQQSLDLLLSHHPSARSSSGMVLRHHNKQL